MAVNNNVQNSLLDNKTKRLIINEIEKINTKLILKISKNVDKKKKKLKR